MSSEVAAMRASIEAEYQALHNMMLPASVASHEVIHNKYASLEKCIEELKQIVGEKEANKIACDIYCRVVR